MPKLEVTKEQILEVLGSDPSTEALYAYDFVEEHPLPRDILIAAILSIVQKHVDTQDKRARDARVAYVTLRNDMAKVFKRARAEAGD